MGGEAGTLRILMSIDAVGGVWRYAMDLASGLRSHGAAVVFAGFGPKPTEEQRGEAEAIGRLIWVDAPLDWTAQEQAELAGVPERLADLATRERVDLVHLNLPSQAAGLDVPVPVLVVSHSCVVTWFAAVRGRRVPEDWRWLERLNRLGLDRADAVLAPSRSHAAIMRNAYPGIPRVEVVYNGSAAVAAACGKEDFVFAAGRWWDDGKNGAVLDAAAARIGWPVVMAGPDTGPNGQSLKLRNARHCGPLPHDRVMALMRKAAIVASPSLYEPFGLAALEAARCGAALVLADIPTYRELWDGAALFADPRDPSAFAARINRLATDRALRRLLADKATTRSRSFTLEAQTVSMNHIYRLLASRTRALSAA